MMRVAKYIPDRLFGFVSDEAGREVYFHLGDFDPKGPWPKLVHDCPPWSIVVLQLAMPTANRWGTC